MRSALRPFALAALWVAACAPNNAGTGDQGSDGGSCEGVTCLAGESCVDGQCVTSGCAAVPCGADEVCVSGTCYPSACNGVACPAGDFCSAGLCVTQACAGVTCPTDEVCVQGDCQPTTCGGVACPTGDVCVNGACVSAACMGINCPAGETCTDGLCGLPTGATTGSGATTTAGGTLGSSTGRTTTGTATASSTSGVMVGATTGGAVAAASTGAAAAGTTSGVAATTVAAASSGTTGAAATSSSSTTTSGGSISAPYTVSTFSGSGTEGFMEGAPGVAEFDNPYGLAIDTAGNLYLADAENNRIRLIDPAGNVSTFAGTGTGSLVNSTPLASTFSFPIGVAVAPSGEVYVGDFANNVIRKIAAGMVSTLAGNGTAGFMDGAPGLAEFYYPNGVAVDGSGNVYVADYLNNRIRMVDPAGTVSTLAGNGTPGFVNGTLGASGTSEFHYPYDVALNTQGQVILVDSYSYSVREITATTVVTLAGDGTEGSIDGHGPPGDTAEFDFPNGIATDGAGNIYIADTNNAKVRKLDPLGNVTTVAGNGTPGCVPGSGGDTGTAQLSTPHGIATDHLGNIYVVDGSCERVWVIK